MARGGRFAPISEGKFFPRRNFPRRNFPRGSSPELEVPCEYSNLSHNSASGPLKPIPCQCDRAPACHSVWCCCCWPAGSAQLAGSGAGGASGGHGGGPGLGRGAKCDLESAAGAPRPAAAAALSLPSRPDSASPAAAVLLGGGWQAAFRAKPRNFTLRFR
jgi:hypothetical protein